MIQHNSDFWNQHSLEFLEMAFETGHREIIQNPDGYGKKTGECGDTVAFFIMVDNGTLTHLSFEVQGCLHTTACCNTVVHLARGKTVDQAWEILPDDVAAYLKTLPDNHWHCAELSVGGFYLALSDYLKKQKGKLGDKHGRKTIMGLEHGSQGDPGEGVGNPV